MIVSRLLYNIKGRSTCINAAILRQQTKTEKRRILADLLCPFCGVFAKMGKFNLNVTGSSILSLSLQSS